KRETRSVYVARRPNGATPRDISRHSNKFTSSVGASAASMHRRIDIADLDGDARTAGARLPDALDRGERRLGIAAGRQAQRGDEEQHGPQAAQPEHTRARAGWHHAREGERRRAEAEGEPEKERRSWPAEHRREHVVRGKAVEDERYQ